MAKKMAIKTEIKMAKKWPSIWRHNGDKMAKKDDKMVIKMAKKWQKKDEKMAKKFQQYGEKKTKKTPKMATKWR